MRLRAAPTSTLLRSSRQDLHASAAARCRLGSSSPSPASGMPMWTRFPSRVHISRRPPRVIASAARAPARRGIYSRRLPWSAHRRRPFPRGSADRRRDVRSVSVVPNSGTNTRISRNPSSRSSTSAATGLRLYMSSAFTSAPSAAICKSSKCGPVRHPPNKTKRGATDTRNRPRGTCAGVARCRCDSPLPSEARRRP